MVLQLQKPWFIFFLSRLSKCARASQPENKVKLKTNKLQPTPQSTTHAGRGWYKLPPSSQAEVLVILLPSSREIFYYPQEWNDELNRVLFWGPSKVYLQVLGRRERSSCSGCSRTRTPSSRRAQSTHS
jgi:hypothetical protein